MKQVGRVRQQSKVKTKEDKAEEEFVNLVNKVEEDLDEYIEEYGNTFAGNNVEKHLAFDLGLRLFRKYGVQVKFNKGNWEIDANIK
jgi:hypothetical protein